ncbi:MAG: hypothetical protein ACRCZ0_01845 [Cetobacterium sp.]
MLLTMLSFIVAFGAAFFEVSWQEEAIYAAFFFGACSLLWRRKMIFGDINED